MILGIILQAISLEALNFRVHCLNSIVSMHLLLFELFQHHMLAIKVSLDFIQYWAFSVSFSLENSKITDCLVSVMVCDTNLRFKILVLLSWAHNVDLEVVVHFISLILVINQALHIRNILLSHVVLLNQVSSVSVYPVQFLENEVQSTLKRFIVVIQLVQIILRGDSVRIDWRHRVERGASWAPWLLPQWTAWTSRLLRWHIMWMQPLRWSPITRLCSEFLDMSSTWVHRAKIWQVVVSLRRWFFISERAVRSPLVSWCHRHWRLGQLSRVVHMIS